MKQLTFIDLFAGCGGIRLAFNRAGCRCVFTSEIDKFAQDTYEANFGEKPAGDITKIDEHSIPQHDILVGGFPCQSFSICGVSKRKSQGRPHGFGDKTQGTLFFDIARILDAKHPRAFMLENVKNLASHDNGNTLKTIINTLRDIGYSTSHKVIDAGGLVPQHRERIFIVGFFEKSGETDIFGEDNKDANFEFPSVQDNGMRLKDILQSNVDDKYTITDNLMKCFKRHKERHQNKGNGFGFQIANINEVSKTLTARYYKDGGSILIPQKGKNPRRLTPRECARLQGFPEDFMIAKSDSRAYKQLGNSVAVPLVTEIAKLIVKRLS